MPEPFVPVPRLLSPLDQKIVKHFAGLVVGEEAHAEIVHLHFANPDGRKWPKNPDEDPEYARFFALMKQIHYNQRLSIEGRGTLDADGAASLAFFHHM